MVRKLLSNIVAKLIIGAVLMQPISSSKLTLFDFTKTQSLGNWTEVSDTVREVGKSKATLVLQTTKQFQRAVFFSLLNPQPNGAGFAGVSTAVDFDLSHYEDIVLICRAQGNIDHFKVTLRHENLHNEEDITFEKIFKITPSNGEFETIKLPLSQFQPYCRGQLVPEAKPLNKTKITEFGLQVFGGVYLDYKQSGTSSLEIDMIYAC